MYLTCSDCRYYVKETNEHHTKAQGEHGFCHALPPTVLQFETTAFPSCERPTVRKFDRACSLFGLDQSDDVEDENG